MDCLCAELRVVLAALGAVGVLAHEEEGLDDDNLVGYEGHVDGEVHGSGDPVAEFCGWDGCGGGREIQKAFRGEGAGGGETDSFFKEDAAAVAGRVGVEHDAVDDG